MSLDFDTEAGTVLDRHLSPSQLRLLGSPCSQAAKEMQAKQSVVLEPASGRSAVTKDTPISKLSPYWRVCAGVVVFLFTAISCAATYNVLGAHAATDAMPRRGVCNVTARYLKTERTSLQISPSWSSTCEHKVLQQFPSQVLSTQRNWCWIGLKAECHANLKAHLSWGVLQAMAAEKGQTQPLEDGAVSPLKNPHVCDLPELGRTRQWTISEKTVARKWFGDNVAVYVLSLPGSTERWSQISQRLQDLHIEAVKVQGVDMRIERSLENAKANGWVPEAYNFTRAQGKAYRHKQQMGSILGTLGCASAHFKAQAKVIEDGKPLAVVFEDDSWPVDDFVERLWALVSEELPCDWEVASLYSRCPHGTCISPHLARVQPDTNEDEMLCRHGVNWGMQGMLYRTSHLPALRVKWQSTVFNEDRPHCMDVDVALASMSDQVGFYAVPAAQNPGFLQEANHESARWTINMAAARTTSVRPPLTPVMNIRKK